MVARKSPDLSETPCCVAALAEIETAPGIDVGEPACYSARNITKQSHGGVGVSFASPLSKAGP